MLDPILDIARIDRRLDSRAVTFENPTGGRGTGGTAHGGRKGAPNRIVAAGESVVLADLEGPGIVRHLWCTVPRRRPERMRALTLEVRYDGRAEPSIAVPLLDFFGLPHGRTVAYASALTTAQEGRGFNSYVPMPFGERFHLTFTNHSDADTVLYFQADYTLVPELADDAGLLHVRFRRENPTTMREDFTIASDLTGPGRFLGCVVGVRPIDPGRWYGEGEVKVYRDGDTDLPTICGTGLEDYVGTAWGMGAHAAPYAGAPLVVPEPGGRDDPMGSLPDFVGFYRWHVPDPIVFERDLRVTIQQIGAVAFDDDAARAAYEQTNPVAGEGWQTGGPMGAVWGICERVDDYSAAAFTYCTTPQPVPAVDVAGATADISRR